MKKVVLDTNFLMLPHTKKIDIFDEISRLINENYEAVTFTCIIKELNDIIKNKASKGRDKTAAKVALKLIEKKGVKVIEKTSNVDEAILEYAKENKDTVVCTNDKELRKKVQKVGVETIGMRSIKHLDWVNPNF